MFESRHVHHNLGVMMMWSCLHFVHLVLIYCCHAMAYILQLSYVTLQPWHILMIIVLLPALCVTLSCVGVTRVV